MKTLVKFSLLCVAFSSFASFCFSSSVIVNEADPEARREIGDRFGPGASASYYARSGMVTSSSNHATLAGLEILRAGGNAFDAAAAVQMVLCVTEPYASGIGGGLFAMGYKSDSGEVFSLDSREESPEGFSSDRFLDDKGKLIGFRKRHTGGNPVGIPGTVAGFFRILEEHGTMSFAEISQPAIRIARDGFRVPEIFALNLSHHWDRIVLFPEAKRLYGRPDGTPLQAGDLLRSPDLADTLALIGKEGVDVFYRGEIARDIVASVQNDPVQPGLLSMEDLDRYRTVARAPIAVEFGEYSVYGMPMPSSGGTTLGLMLNMLQAHGFEGLKWGTAETFNLMLNIQNIAFADRNHYMADADFVDVPVAGLLDPAYGAKRASFIDSEKAVATPIAPGVPANASVSMINFPLPEESETTTHFSVVDRDRNVVAITSTIEQHFGSGIVVAGRGFLLNNQLTDFDARLRDKNGNLGVNRSTPELLPRRTAIGEEAKLLGGKRPRSSMTPTIMLKDGAPYVVMGSPGGSRIIGVVFNVLVNSMVFGFDLQKAINAPRVIGRNGPPEMESPLYRNEKLREEMKEKGFDIVDSKAAGSVQAIRINDNGWLEGAADPRREGLALGY